MGMPVYIAIYHTRKRRQSLTRDRGRSCKVVLQGDGDELIIRNPLNLFFTCIHARIENDASMASWAEVCAAGIAKSSRNPSASSVWRNVSGPIRYIQSESGGRLVIFRHRSLFQM